ncbi:pyridoxal phosphate-dependent aminotransferase [Natronospira sp.]
MSDFLSDRVKRLQPSPTLAVTQKAAELRAAGQDIIGLGAGEPDFDTPDNIKQAAIEAIRAGASKYTAVDGTPELKQAVIDKFKRDNGLDYELNQILVSTGAKQSLFNLCQAVVNAGDEVIIPAPYWVSYPAMVEIAGGRPVFVTADWEQDYKITPEQLEAAITDKTKLVMLNSPSNPTGLAYTREEFQALAEVLKRHPRLLIATDDMYEHILWTEEPFVTLLNVAPELYDRTVVFNGVSKAYAMTGWRIGYAGGPAEIIGAMKKVQGQSTSNPAAVSQAAAREALAGDQSKVGEMVKAFKQRHDRVYDLLREIPGVRVKPSMGTFYSFPDFRVAIEKLKGINDDKQLAEFLLKEAGVALVPGSAFGLPGHMRLSYATDMATLEDACGRIRKAIESA